MGWEGLKSRRTYYSELSVLLKDLSLYYKLATDESLMVEYMYVLFEGDLGCDPFRFLSPF